MRPLFYVSDGYPIVTQTFTRDEVRGLVQDGLPLTLVSLYPPGPGAPAIEPRLDPPVLRVPRGHAADPWRALLRRSARKPRAVAALLGEALLPHTDPFRVRSQLRAPSLVARGAWLAERVPRSAHLHAQFTGHACTVAWVASVLSGATFSFTAHSEWSFPFIRRKLRHASFALAVSDLEKRRLLERVPDVPPSRIVVHRLGVDLGGWESDARAHGPGPVRLVSVGSLTRTKGHEVLVAAVAELARRGIDVRLEILGGGPLGPRLSRLVRRLGVEDRVVLRGAVPHDEVRRAVRSGDVAVLACRATSSGDFDGIPVSLMEAMASSRPVVSTRVGAIPELVEDGLSGLLVEPDRPADLADALARLVESPDLRLRLGQAGRRVVAERHDARRARRRLAGLFRDVLQGDDSAVAPGGG